MLNCICCVSKPCKQTSNVFRRPPHRRQKLWRYFADDVWPMALKNPHHPFKYMAFSTLYVNFYEINRWHITEQRIEWNAFYLNSATAPLNRPQ